MMFPQSTNRVHRPSRSKARILLVAAAFAVVLWLLYQTTNSSDGKVGFSETDDSKIVENLDVDVDLGRKINAGSENGLSTTPFKENFDEIHGETENWRDHVETSDNGDMENLSEYRKESEESQEETTDGGNKEENVDNESTQEKIQLVNPRDTDEENRQSENGAVDRNNSGDGEPDRGESVTTDTASTESPTTEEVTENVDHSNSNAATNFPDSNGVPAKEEVTSEGQVDGNSLIEAVANATNSEGDNANDNSSSQESSVEMSDKDRIPKEVKVESQLGNGEITEGGSVEVTSGSDFDGQSDVSSNQGVSQSLKANATAEEGKDQQSVDVNTNSSVSNEEHRDLPENRANSASEVVKNGSDLDGQSDVSSSEQGINEHPIANATDREKDLKSSDEDTSNSSVGNEEHVELPGNGLNSTPEAQNQQNPGEISNEEGSTEKEGDGASSSSANNEQSNSEAANNESSNEENTHEDTTENEHKDSDTSDSSNQTERQEDGVES